MANVKPEIINFSVIIQNPNTPAGKVDEIGFNLTGDFYEHPTQYGNGYGLAISGNGFDNAYDIRYDTSFDPDNKREYLERWARGYWTGKNGAYAVKSITFKN